VSWLRVPDEGDLPEDARSLFDKPREKLGFIPNVLRNFSIRPAHLVSWNTYYEELMRGESGLSKPQREMIAVAVSSANRCHYCIVSHSAALRKLTGDPALADTIAANYKYAELEPKERAMLDFAVKLTREIEKMSREDVETLLAAGWTEEDVFDIAEVTAMFNFTNRLASGLGWQPNAEYFTLGR
jgi:uncharacterized peroxidase-related enzyme